MKTLDIALAVLCAMFVLTLAAPRAVLAASHDQTAETSHEVFDACAEPYRLSSMVQSFEANLHIPRPYVASRLQSEEALHAELQVPATLLRTLVLEEGISRSLELHLPAALLATLLADGRLQMPQRSQQPCPLFFSLELFLNKIEQGSKVQHKCQRRSPSAPHFYTARTCGGGMQVSPLL